MPGTVTDVGAAAAFTYTGLTLTGRFDLMNVGFRTSKRASPTITIYNPATGGTGTMRAQNAGTNLTATANNISQGHFFIALDNQAVQANDFLRAQWVAAIEL